jgi:hypothetical protein
MSSAFWSASLALFSGLLAACSSAPRPFPVQDPMWRDEADFREFGPQPAEYEPATFWEVFDYTMLRPLPHSLKLEVGKPAVNVNSWDEVPDSSWFTNRLRDKAPTPSEAARGSCDHTIDPAGPFEVIGGKPDGLNPGFLIQTKAGKKYFFKFDVGEQPERATAADVIGSKIYHFVGYHAPCNQIVYFDPKILSISPKATLRRADGRKTPMTQEDVNEAFKVVKPNAKGLVRGFASEFLPGKPLGGWTYEGTRDDDLNDVIPHEDRREVRGGVVLAAWTNHFDSRDQNTLTMWVDDNKDGLGYVRHHIIDFGDCFGSLWAIDEMSRRHGQTYYLKMGHLLADFATLGVIERPWDKAELGPAGKSLGYYNAENFDPDDWHNGYPLPGFSRMEEGDAAWMARLVAEMTDDHLNAMIDEAKIENKVFDRELRRAIFGRRDKVLKRWLGKLSPLSHPKVENGRVCLRDLAVHAKIVKAEERTYTSSSGPVTLDSGRVCTSLPSSPSPYYTVSLTAGSTSPLLLHFSQNRLIALER